MSQFLSVYAPYIINNFWLGMVIFYIAGCLCGPSIGVSALFWGFIGAIFGHFLCYMVGIDTKSFGFFLTLITAAVGSMLFGIL